MAEDHLSPEDMSDYWTPDASAEAIDRIEAHAFVCAECARQLDAARSVADAVRDAMRSGRLRAIITDAVLNRLAREGAQVRTFTLDPGAVVPCAVWPGDDVTAVRLRADFSGLERVTLATYIAGAEVDRITDIPVRPQVGELIEAFPADELRHVPRTDVRLLVFGSRGAGPDELVAEYTLQHGGTMERDSARLP